MGVFFEYTGIVEKVYPMKTFESGFQKREIVLGDDLNLNTKHPNHICFTFKVEYAEKIANAKPGDRAKILFAIDGREWTSPAGEIKHFTDLIGIKYDVIGHAEIQNSPSAPPAAEPKDGAADAPGEIADDMPF